MSYAHQKMLAVAVAAVLAGLAIVQVANPADFGLTAVQARWLGVVGAMLGVLAGFLPSVRGMASDPEFLINRIADLPVHEQQTIASVLADRAEHRRPGPADHIVALIDRDEAALDDERTAEGRG